MGIIRKVKESDYDFILSSLKENNFALSSGVEKSIMKPIIEDKYSVTLVYEENSEPKAFYTVVTHPESFMKSFYQNMNLYTRIKYQLKNKLDALASEKSSEIVNIPQKCQTMLSNMFSANGEYTISLFMVSKAKKSVAKDFFLKITSLIDKYPYMLGVIKKDNYGSIMIHKMIFGDSIEFYDVDKDSYFCVIDIEQFRKAIEKDI